MPPHLRWDGKRTAASGAAGYNIMQNVGGGLSAMEIKKRIAKRKGANNG